MEESFRQLDTSDLYIPVPSAPETMRLTGVLEGRGHSSLGGPGSASLGLASFNAPTKRRQRVPSSWKPFLPWGGDHHPSPEVSLLNFRSHEAEDQICPVHLCVPSTGDRPGPSQERRQCLLDKRMSVGSERTAGPTLFCSAQWWQLATMRDCKFQTRRPSCLPLKATSRPGGQAAIGETNTVSVTEFPVNRTLSQGRTSRMTL